MKHPISKWFKSGEQNDATDNTTNEQVQNIPVERIIPNPFQPRTVFDEEGIKELSQTIKTHGVIQPIVVRKNSDRYEIIAGERRWRAVKTLGWSWIPAIIKTYNDSEAASIALIENLQREELTSIEEARAYSKLLKIQQLTQEGLAEMLGIGQSTVANKLRLLKLPDAVQDALKNRQITERHARALLSVTSEEKQVKLLKEITDQQLNVKQIEERLRKSSPVQKKKLKKRGYGKDTRVAVNTIHRSINMVKENGLLIEAKERENDQFYEITIRIPKSS